MQDDIASAFESFCATSTKDEMDYGEYTERETNLEIETLAEGLEKKAEKHKQAALDGDESHLACGKSHGELASFYPDQARARAREIEALEQRPSETKGHK